MTPAQAYRITRRLIYMAVIGVLAWGMIQYDFIRVDAADDGVTHIQPGTLLLTRSARKEGGLKPDELYLMIVRDAKDQRSLRLVRVAAVEGEEIHRSDDAVWVGERRLRVPPYAVQRWPERVSAGHCLVLTDQPGSSTLDSRRLGEIQVEALAYRVIVPLSF